MIRVAQCWDDGVYTDRRLIEIFRKYGAKATFNLCPGTIPEEDIPAHWVPQRTEGWSHKGFRGGRIGKKNLREVYGDFCVASHCMHHEVAGTMPLEDFMKGAVEARRFLEEMFERECPGFAWPCGGFTQEAADAMKDAGFAYGRTCRYTDNVLAYEHPMLLDSNCHFQDGNFWQKFDNAKQNSGVFYFWGHSYEMMDSEGMWKQLEDRIAALSADPDVVWVDVADLVKG